MLNTEMATTERPDNSIFRPWSEKEEKDRLAYNAARNNVNSTNAQELVLNLSMDRTTPKSEACLEDLSSRTRSPLSAFESKREPEVISPTMKRAGLHDLNPALFQQIHWQNYLQTLQFQLLAMSRLPRDSTPGILHVHHQALLTAQLQQAQKHFLQPGHMSNMIRRQCSAPAPDAFRVPTSPVYPRQPFVSEPNSPDNNNVGHFPLPSAKDGEPLDLLPKSLYLNKSQGGHLCIFCGKVYSRKYGLKIHLRTHTGYKPLKCKVCARPFGDPSNLNKHIRLHAEGDTPYRCEHCGKVLVRRRDLERHIRSRHPDAAVDLPLESDFDTEQELNTSESEMPDLREVNNMSHNDELDVVG